MTQNGYGIGVPRTPGLVTPHAGLTLNDGAGRTWRTGARWRVAREAAFGLEATREGGGDDESSGSAVLIWAMKQVRKGCPGASSAGSPSAVVHARAMVRDSGRGTRRSPSARTAGGADAALALALVKPRHVHHPVDAIATSTGARSDLDEVQYPGDARLASLFPDEVVDGGDEAGLVRGAQRLTARLEPPLGSLQGKLEAPVVDRSGFAHGANVELESEHLAKCPDPIPGGRTPPADVADELAVADGLDRSLACRNAPRLEGPVDLAQQIGHGGKSGPKRARRWREIALFKKEIAPIIGRSHVDRRGVEP